MFNNENHLEDFRLRVRSAKRIYDAVLIFYSNILSSNTLIRLVISENLSKLSIHRPIAFIKVKLKVTSRGEYKEYKEMICPPFVSHSTLCIGREIFVSGTSGRK